MTRSSRRPSGIVYEPAGRDGALAWVRRWPLVRWSTLVYKFDAADVVLSLDADFLELTGPGALRYARDFMAIGRRLTDGAKEMNRLYAVESTLTDDRRQSRSTGCRCGRATSTAFAQRRGRGRRRGGRFWQ